LPKGITQINYNYLTARIFSLQRHKHADFESLATEVFELQYRYNPVYKMFCDSLSVSPAGVRSIGQIPFLPIQAFKTRKVLTALFEKEEELVFESSGTTGDQPSRHHVADAGLYERSFLEGFRLFYGEPSDYCILALLPSYLERGGSSLVYMAERLIAASGDEQSGFYLHDLDRLCVTLGRLAASGKKALLLGVSYALLDLAGKNLKLADNIIVMETGGMKGRRQEMLKSELHEVLKQKLGLASVHSEYGMTELLSQAYSHGEGIFETPPWMKVLVRDPNDPFAYLAAGKTGGINVIDLANLNSCSFISTQDLGKLHGDAQFEVMGRFDNSDIRGCNLMVD
jgi:phenylacetate-coenzyme A ligase PaaK-like adenylate-forming protein